MEAKKIQQIVKKGLVQQYQVPIGEIINRNEVVFINSRSELEVIIGFMPLFGNPIINRGYLYDKFKDYRALNIEIVFDCYKQNMQPRKECPKFTISFKEFLCRIEKNNKIRAINAELKKKQEVLGIREIMQFNMIGAISDMCYTLSHDLIEQLEKKNKTLVGASSHRIKNLIADAKRFSQSSLCISKTFFETNKKHSHEEISETMQRLSDTFVMVSKHAVNTCLGDDNNAQKIVEFCKSLPQARLFTSIEQEDINGLIPQEARDELNQ